MNEMRKLPQWIGLLLAIWAAMWISSAAVDFVTKAPKDCPTSPTDYSQTMLVMDEVEPGVWKTVTVPTFDGEAPMSAEMKGQVKAVVMLISVGLIMMAFWPH